MYFYLLLFNCQGSIALTLVSAATRLRESLSIIPQSFAFVKRFFKTFLSFFNFFFQTLGLGCYRFCGNLDIIPHLLDFVKRFFKSFLKFFQGFFKTLWCVCRRFCGNLGIISHSLDFVKGFCKSFLKNFKSFFNRLSRSSWYPVSRQLWYFTTFLVICQELFWIFLEFVEKYYKIPCFLTLQSTKSSLTL